MSVPPPNQHAPTSTPPSTLQSSQTNGNNTNGDSKPAELPPYERVDIEAIKQELHGLLGEHGLPYWKALNGFLLGQLRRDELVSMVRKWLKGPHLQLHNNLLLGLLYNASIPTSSSQSPSQRKRRKIGHDDPLFDADETNITPKARVTSWVTGLTGKERNRIRRAVLSRDDDADGEDADDWDLRRRRVPTFTPTAAMPPLALSERHLPSSQQLSLRLGALAKAYDLTLAPDATTELGELLAIGIDSHLGDVFHNLVRLTGSDRHGVDTIHLPSGTSHDPVRTSYDDSQTHERDDNSLRIKEERDLPKPDINTLQYLFAMNPDSHQQSSPALYKLQTSQIHHTIIKAEPSSPPRKPDVDGEGDHEGGRSPPPRHAMIPATNTTSPSKPMTSLPGLGASSSKAQIRQERLINNELLKIDRGREEGEGKKDRKHNLHWKYEDPATIFKDILG